MNTGSEETHVAGQFLHNALMTCSDTPRFVSIPHTDDVDSIYDVPDASGAQEEEGTVQGTDQENAAHGPITNKLQTSKGIDIPE